jgi:putative ATP-dependent endonuclease of OLD family
MRLRGVSLTNFRAYGAETFIKLDPLTILIGKNDSGKSSILDALDIFFNDAKIEKADCCVRTRSTDVRIACVFDQLPASLVIDDQHETSLDKEYLLRADGMLEIIKMYDCSLATPKLKDVFVHAAHPSAASYSDLLTLKLAELKARAQQLQIDLSNVNQTAKSPIRKAIWAASPNLQITDSVIPLKKEAAKDAFDQIQNYMPSYALFKSDRASTDQDAEAQDPLKSAIKSAIQAREAELAAVVNEVTAELTRVATRTVEKIREMSPELANQLQPSVTTKKWDTLFTVTLTGDNQIPINKRGSGTRRLVLLNFFRAQAEEAAKAKGTGIIYAVEEPETSQHPNHQIILLNAFQDLVAQGNCQILLTTHTPTLARRVDQSNLRLVAQQDGQPIIEDGAVQATLDKIVKTLGVLPDHDVKVFLGVEGKHDINFLKHISSILAPSEVDIPDLAAAEAAGTLVFIPLGGSSLDVWVNRLGGLNRPEFYLTDRDNQPPDPPKYEAAIAQWRARAGCTAWVTSKKELENYLHRSLLSNAAPGYAGTGADFDDVPALFAEAVHTAAQSPDPWASLSDEKRKKKMSNAKWRLNDEIVKQMTPALLRQVDTQDEIRQWLRAVGAALQG